MQRIVSVRSIIVIGGVAGNRVVCSQRSETPLLRRAWNYTASLRSSWTASTTRRSGKLDIRQRVEPAEAEPQAAAGVVLAKAERQQDVAGPGIGRRAGGPAADRQVAHRQQQGFAIDVAERQVEVAGQPQRMPSSNARWAAEPDVVSRSMRSAAS